MGCASIGYQRAGTSLEDARADESRCRYQAQVACGNMPAGAERGMRLSELTTACMRQLGYEGPMFVK